MSLAELSAEKARKILNRKEAGVKADGKWRTTERGGARKISGKGK